MKLPYLTIIQFLKFSIVGLSNTIISYVIYALLVFFGTQYIIANLAAFIVSVANSFFWNNKYIFKPENGISRNLIYTLIKTYISYAFSGILIANILLYIYIDRLGISKYLAPLFVLFITVPINFLLNKLWAFKTKKSSRKI